MEAYASWCTKAGEFKAEKAEEAARLGDILLQQAGSIANAAKALRQVRHTRLGNALEGVMDMTLAEWIEQDHLDYLQSAAQTGVEVRREGERGRMRANPTALP